MSFRALICGAGMALATVMGSVAAEARPACFPTPLLERQLAGKHSERVFDEYTVEGITYQLWIDPSTGRGSLVQQKGEISCLVMPLKGIDASFIARLRGYTLIHDWYTGLRSPRSNVCCNDRDCRPVQHRSTPGGTGYEVLINDTWRAVETDMIVGLFSPDGQAHACWSGGSGAGPRPWIRCVILPGMGV